MKKLMNPIGTVTVLAGLFCLASCAFGQEAEGRTSLEQPRFSPPHVQPISRVEITTSGSVITSTNHPNNYGNHEDRTWVIRFPEGEKIKLEFIAFNLEPARRNRCVWDSLEVRDGGSRFSQKIGESLCGSSLPQPIISSGNELFVRFRSDRSVVRSGFEILVVTAFPAPEELGPEAPSKARYEEARDALKVFLESKGLIPLAVRLAFHDCVGPDGCNGCLNLNKGDNAGLAGIVEELGAVRQGAGEQTFTDISNADFWQIAGISALESGNSKVDITFKGGRVDCPTSPDDVASHVFPSPDMSRKEMMDWFATPDFGFGRAMTEQQVTALMGAHSLGGASISNSGYSGQWVPESPNVFDNQFYQRLTAGPWNYKNKAILDASDFEAGTTDLKFQWDVFFFQPEAFVTSFLLNTDIELIFDIDVDNTGLGTQCGGGLDFDEFIQGSGTDLASSQPCQEASTKAQVENYANDEDTFLADFKLAYELMMTAKTNGATLSEPQ